MVVVGSFWSGLFRCFVRLLGGAPPFAFSSFVFGGNFPLLGWQELFAEVPVPVVD